MFASRDIILSYPFGIPQRGLDSFYLDPVNRTLDLVNWHFADLPEDLMAYTYVLDASGFEPHGEWQWVARAAVEVLEERPFPLRAMLAKHFAIWEIERKKIA